MSDEVDFLHAGKLATNWYYDFNGAGMVEHSQNSQNSKFAMSLQYL